MIAIVIPALNPDAALPGYCRDLRAITDAPIVLVDDGSRVDLAHIFDDCAAAASGVTVLRHGVNRGKGRGLKTAFEHLLRTVPGLVGCVTADADGQHTPADVRRCLEALRDSPDALVLGCRSFTGPGIPFRSRFGNLAIRLLFRLVTGHPFTDTQTGLRAIPADFMRELLDVPGERFDFETRMLVALGRRPLVQLPIETVYLNHNAASHFHPLRDSLHIIGVLLSSPPCRMLAVFMLVSLLSWVIDQGGFHLLYRLAFREGFPHRLLTSVAGARAVSLLFNYFTNRRFVFHYDPARGNGSFLRYLLLALPLLAASWALTHAATQVWPAVRWVEFLKMAADLLLFLLSFAIQKLFVFRHR